MRDGCAYTGDSRTAMYDAIGKGEVEAVKEGKRTLLVFRVSNGGLRPVSLRSSGPGTNGFGSCGAWGQETLAAGANAKRSDLLPTNGKHAVRVWVF